MVGDGAPDPTTERLLHVTIDAVRRDYQQLSYHTAIAKLITLTNHLIKTGGAAPRSVVEPLVLMTAPLAPHVCEELWQRLGHDTSLARHPFPVADPALLTVDTVDYPIQVKGKVRARIQVAADADPAAVEAAALADERVIALLAGATSAQGRRGAGADGLDRRVSVGPRPLTASTVGAGLGSVDAHRTRADQHPGDRGAPPRCPRDRGHLLSVSARTGCPPGRAPRGDAQLAMAESQPSGVRLEFTTAATTVELDGPRPCGSATAERRAARRVFDLVVDGRLAGQASLDTATVVIIDMVTGEQEIRPAGVDTITFPDLPRREVHRALAAAQRERRAGRAAHGRTGATH